VKQLLSQRDAQGRIPFHPYAKWYGAHWVLVALADLGYPPGDQTLIPLRDQVYAWLIAGSHGQRVEYIQGQVRLHGSIEGNAVYALLSLGLADERVETLVRRLLDSRWPDGGWNCDRHATGTTSSFVETLIPLRALALHARLSGNIESRAAVEQAAEIFLKRHLYRRVRDGRVMAGDFVRLHFPCYYHYDILFGLKVMTEAGFATDPRCADALDLLETKRLPDGGFPAETRYYRVRSEHLTTGCSLVDWGGCSTRHMNEWVTVDALSVLTAAGRLTAATIG
jgi:hypothetical protein